MIDNRTPRNPWDISQYDIYNPSGLGGVSPTLMELFCPSGIKMCATCPLEYSNIIPQCFIPCLWGTHLMTPTIKYPDGYPFVESIISRNPFSLHIKKPHFFYTYYKKLDFMFMSSWLHGIILDHLDGNAFNDSEENLVPIVSSQENMQRGKDLIQLQKKFKDLWKNTKRNGKMPEEIQEIILKMNEHLKKEADQRIYQLIEYTNKAISENKIFVPPKSWWVKRNNSEVLIYVEKKLKEEPEKYYHPEK
jgi:hypothetical protein